MYSFGNLKCKVNRIAVFVERKLGKLVEKLKKANSNGELTFFR